jgi:hypothetical protein
MRRPAKRSQSGGLAVHNQHFETGIVVEMGVTGGDHQLVVRM